MTTTDYRGQFDLSGRVAVVTGGAGFLGRSFCQAYAESGASIAVVDKNERDCVDFASELAKRYAIGAVGIGCDIADPGAVEAMSARVSEVLGPIRILHNNAANQSSGLKAQFAPFEEFDFADWRRVMSVDVDGAFLVAQAVGRRMAAHGLGGSIIQTGSIYGVIAPDNRIYAGATYDGKPICSPAVYSAAKAAIIGLTRWLATYWAQRGIRVNAIVPGGIEDKQNEAFKRQYSARVPLGRMARRDELTGAALFLASDASTYVTGQCLIVDGGLSAW